MAIKLIGDVENKFRGVEKALASLERRIDARSITAPLTPIIISEYVSESGIDGVIYKGIIPIDAVITKVVIDILQFEDPNAIQNGFTITVRSKIGNKINEMIFNSRKQRDSMICSVNVVGGSLVTISIDKKCYEVYVGAILELPKPIYRQVEFVDGGSEE